VEAIFSEDRKNLVKAEEAFRTGLAENKHVIMNTKGRSGKGSQ
jgi:hypothetical protein